MTGVIPAARRSSARDGTRVVPVTSYPAARKSGSIRRPIAPVAPARKTFFTNHGSAPALLARRYFCSWRQRSRLTRNGHRRTRGPCSVWPLPGEVVFFEQVLHVGAMEHL